MHVAVQKMGQTYACRDSSKRHTRRLGAIHSGQTLEAKRCLFLFMRRTPPHERQRRGASVVKLVKVVCSSVVVVVPDSGRGSAGAKAGGALAACGEDEGAERRKDDEDASLVDGAQQREEVLLGPAQLGEARVHPAVAHQRPCAPPVLRKAAPLEVVVAEVPGGVGRAVPRRLRVELVGKPPRARRVLGRKVFGEQEGEPDGRVHRAEHGRAPKVLGGRAAVGGG
mmetsp:Transcript_46665/g.146695  ORF Transcript_46665/g.146695 Transcript_46665/m.146695 type:complete len:225 (+) Transcript_46665:454-1128(+)